MTSIWWVALAAVSAPSDYMGGTFCAAHGPIADSGVLRLANGHNMCWRNAANDGNACVSVDASNRLLVPSYVKNQHVPIGAAVLGPTAPAAVNVGNGRCYQFNQAQTTETIHTTWIVAGEWDATSDMELHMRVFPEAGDPLADGETIEFDVSYNALSPGDAYDKASTTIAVSYTQSGPGAEKAMLCLDGVLDYDDVTNPLLANEELFVAIDLDEVATTYSGKVTLCQLHTRYFADKIEQKVEQ